MKIEPARIRIEDIQTVNDAELIGLIQRAHELILHKLTKKLQREIAGDAQA